MADEVPAKISNAADDETPEHKALRTQYENWWDEVKKEVEQPPQIQQKGGECCIFTVPKTLKELDDKEMEYKPHIVSFGPYHFLKSTRLSTMERKKSEVVRSILTKLNIHGECFQSKIAEKIKDQEQSIKGCYDGPIQIENSDILSWMMPRDSIFILEFLRQRLLEIHLGNRPKSRQHIRQIMGKNRYIKRKRLGSLIRSMSFEYLRRNFKEEIDSVPVVDIVKDIVKLENQIPLTVMRTILRIEIETMENEKAKSPIGADDDMETSIAVDMLTERVNEKLEKLLANMCLLLSPIVKDVEDDTMNVFDSNSSASKHTFGKMNHILECFRYYVVGNEDEVSIKSSKNDPKVSGRTPLDRSALELDKAGVKFKPCYGGIKEIHFDEASSTLYLPEVDVEIHTETIMRNIMAFELCSPSCGDKAVIRYAHLMDQLIDTEKDVALLTKYHIINNYLGDGSTVAKFWNSLTDATWIAGYQPIDEATEALKVYCRRKRTSVYILWNEFLEEYCSKPWYVVAFVASTILLIMTGLQVWCLFYPCANLNAFGK